MHEALRNYGVRTPIKSCPPVWKQASIDSGDERFRAGMALRRASHPGVGRVAHERTSISGSVSAGMPQCLKRC
jgi:hypothetical protein